MKQNQIHPSAPIVESRQEYDTEKPNQNIRRKQTISNSSKIGEHLEGKQPGNYSTKRTRQINTGVRLVFGDIKAPMSIETND